MLDGRVHLKVFRSLEGAAKECVQNILLIVNLFLLSCSLSFKGFNQPPPGVCVG